MKRALGSKWARRWAIYLPMLVPLYFIDNALFAHHDFIWTWIGCCVVADGVAGRLQRKYWPVR